MYAFRRWSTGIFSGLCSNVDELVTRVENHEALVESALRDLKQELVAARVQLGRVQKDGALLAKRVTDAKTNAALWKERAFHSGNDDQKAMECLKRSRREAAQYSEFSERQEEHELGIKTLRETIVALEQKQEALICKLHLLKTRETSAKALKQAGNSSADFGGDVEEILERWESKIDSVSYAAAPLADVTDDLASEFETAEEQASLQAELIQLREEGGDGER